MTTPSPLAGPRRPSLLLLSIIYLAFISLGLPDSVLGVAWPAMRETLKLPLETVGLLTLVLTVLSAGSSFASGTLTNRFGTGPIVLASCLATGGALLAFSSAPPFVFLLLAALPLGLGAGGVDSSLNAYVAKHYSARHMNWLHSFWGVGATIGPMVMTAALGIGAGWQGGYLWIASVQLILAVLFFATLPLWKRNENLSEAHAEAENGPAGPLTARSSAAWISTVVYALYAAVEFSTGLWANTVLIDSRGLDPSTAGLWIAAYYGSIMGGRMAMGFLVHRWGNRRSVTLGLTLSLAGALLFFLPGIPAMGIPELALAGLVLLGLGFAPVYPCLMHETPRRFTAQAAPVVIGRQVGAAYVGGALLPGLVGWTMARISLEVLAPVLVLVTLAMLFLIRRLNRLS